MLATLCQCQTELVSYIIQRRETLNRLIGLTHSHHSTLKCFAAGHIRLFFKDFPDLEEEAINAVYDLCEDQVSKVTPHTFTSHLRLTHMVFRSG